MFTSDPRGFVCASLYCKSFTFLYVNLTQTVSPQKTGMVRQEQSKGSDKLKWRFVSIPIQPNFITDKGYMLGMSFRKLWFL
jgi:hypothetical protein